MCNRILLMIVTVLFSQYCYSSGIQIGRTRVIYEANKKEVALPLTNKDSQSPWLIQSWVDTGDGKTRGPFIITPPLFRLDPQKEQSLRIAWNGTPLPADRESLFYLNVRSIPAVGKDEEDKNVLHLIYKMRMKLFWRPQGLDGTPGEGCKNLHFKSDAGTFSVLNNSRYFIIFDSLKVGSTALDDIEMVPPLGQVSHPLPMAAGNSQVVWHCITDYGNASARYSAPVERG
ncbi:P pilus assembly chaperone PapD [Yokenella regensburgei]|uniref:P pilus assembly chaperone PapD n=2 Tax=Yokenella regensburgei TaxID=158877 RepID=A0ABX9S0C4_9ENTR|nr:P pilus assembly chaperone PapD [Yokenella regensburgei]